VFRGLLFAVLLALALSAAVVAPALAADPTPAPTPGASPLLIDPLDPRAGAGASEVGAPFLAIFIVLGAGVVTVAATLAYVRMTRRA
jgi:hypothetical protein